jgi:segregation and condensation protein A
MADPEQTSQLEELTNLAAALQRRELDPTDIPLAELSSRLRARVEADGGNLDLLWAAESLREMTRLVELKLGRFDPEEAETPLPNLADPEPDPALRLEEYRLFKAAAEVLLADAATGPKAFLRVLGVPVEPRPTIRLRPEALAAALGEVLSRLPPQVTMEATSPRYSIEIRSASLLEELRARGELIFDQVFAAAADRLEAVVLFMALLDLLNRGLAICEQRGDGPIRVELPVGG